MDMGSITLRKATHEDIHAIITLRSARGLQDLQHLVSIPEPFQELFLYLELEKGQLFVAVNQIDGSIIAQSKIFIVESHDAGYEILAQDLRCIHDHRKLIEHGFFDHHNEFFPGPGEHFIPHQKILYIYVGSLFTHPNHRGRRLNERLNEYAYEQLSAIIAAKIRLREYTTIALIYGIGEENYWRTNSMVRPFLNFIQSLSVVLGWALSEKISFYAYKAYKPEFTVCPAGNLVKLPDEQCRPGRGCILLYELTETSSGF